jgi:ceramide glucosyltransferase
MAWSGALAAVSCLASVRALLRGAAPRSMGTHGGGALVVRPCAGVEPSLADNLRSSGALADAGTFTLVLAVARGDDPALVVARTAADALCASGHDASVMLTHAEGVNQKASQLARVVAAHGSHDTVVVIDSDVDCRGLSLAAWVEALRGDASLGALWVPTVEDGGETFGDRCSDALLAGSLHAFPVLAALDPRGLVGKVSVLRASSLAAVGGFAALECYLGEDMELARRMLASGARVAAFNAVARSRVRGRSWGDVVARYARWITVIRAQRPVLMVSYPAMFFATPLLVACALVLSLARSEALGVAAIAVGARILVALAARRASGTPLRRALGDGVWADALLLAAFVRALRGAPVLWRGRTLTVERGGTLRVL